ncbi:PP2C family protein-serine/threonine phosphatase [soil metagenome]
MPAAGEPISPDLGPVLAEFFDAAHRIEPDRLVLLVETAGAALGATSLRLWLADHEQRLLIHLPVTNHAPLSPRAIEGTSAGRCFVSSEPVERSEADGSDHAWLPLLNGVDRIGVMEIEAPVLDAEHLESFRHLASAATAEIVTRGQYTDRFLEVRRRRHMTLAAELQWQALPPASFTTDDVSVAGILEPAYDVGGDTFDYAHARDRLDVAIFDAVGHDLASTLICTLALGAYRNSRREGGDLRDHAARMDATMHEQLARGSFATGQIGTLDTSTGMFRWLNAGHPPPLLVRDGHVRPLVCKPRLPFGIGHMEPGRVADIAEDQLQPGDGILLYTDGVIEARKPGGEDFGLDRLMEFLHTAFAAGLAPHETLRRLSHAVVDFHEGSLRDDATNLLVVWQQDHH